MLEQQPTRNIKPTAKASRQSAAEEPVSSQDGYADSFGTSPSGAKFADVVQVTIGSPAPSSGPAKPQAAPKATAELIVHALDVLCAYTTWALDADERKRLTADLEPVLAKHAVPDLGGTEELRLAITAVSIGAPRVVDYRTKLQAAKDARKGLADDIASAGQEGQRQERSGSQTRVSQAQGASPALGVLA